MQFATLILEEGTHRKHFVGEILCLVAVLAVSAVSTLGTAALAGELAGVTLPDTLKAGEKTL